jgi:YVTN family beta-propeller protein
MKTYLTVALCLCGFAGVLQARKPKLADAPHAYVTNSLDNTVSVIDTGTNRVTAIVPVGRNPLGLAVGRTAIYVANSEDNTVSVIDPITNEVTKTIQVPYISPFSGGIGAPVGLALSPDESSSISPMLKLGWPRSTRLPTRWSLSMGRTPAG